MIGDFALILILYNSFALIFIFFLKVTVKYSLIKLWLKSILFLILVLFLDDQRRVKVMDFSFIGFSMIVTYFNLADNVIKSFGSLFIILGLIILQEKLLCLNDVVAIEVTKLFIFFSKIATSLA